MTTHHRPSAVATALACAMLVAVLVGHARTAVGVARARADTGTVAWTETNALAPDRIWMAATYMPVTNKILAYGGGTIDSSGLVTGSPTDTLLYSPDNDLWTTLSPQKSGGPPSLTNHTLSWDPVAGVAVMFGRGRTFGFEPTTRRWTELVSSACRPPKCPSSIGSHAQAWSTVLGATLVFGGRTGSGVSAMTNDLWELRAVQSKRGTFTWQWKQRFPHEDPTYGTPPARAWHNMAEIPPGGLDGGKILIYGGWDNKGQALSDTWFYDPESDAYEKVVSAGTPKQRVGFGMAYSQPLDKVVIQGGQTNAYFQDMAFTNDTWAFDPSLATWVPVNIAGPTGDRSGHDLVTTGVGTVILFDQPVGMARQQTWVLK